MGSGSAPLLLCSGLGELRDAASRQVVDECVEGDRRSLRRRGLCVKHADDDIRVEVELVEQEVVRALRLEPQPLQRLAGKSLRFAVTIKSACPRRAAATTCLSSSSGNEIPWTSGSHPRTHASSKARSMVAARPPAGPSAKSGWISSMEIPSRPGCVRSTAAVQIGFGQAQERIGQRDGDDTQASNVALNLATSDAHPFRLRARLRASA